MTVNPDKISTPHANGGDRSADPVPERPASLGAGPLVATRRRLPRAATPDQFEQMVLDLVAEARKSVETYKWLYPSGYQRGRKGSGEKVRRDISGSGGDLADDFDSLDQIRRYLDEASDHIRKALAHSHGAGTALGRCQDRIDRVGGPTLVAIDPLEPAKDIKPFTPDWMRGMTPTEAKDWQARREARVANSRSPFAGEEVTG